MSTSRGYILRVAVCLWALVVVTAPAARAADPMFLTHPQGTNADPLGWDLDDDLYGGPAGFPDPLETMNRCTLRFNRYLDRWFLNPVTRAYAFVLPAPVRTAIRRFLENINSPPVLVNDLLQREWRDAGTTVARFVVNSTAGAAGFFDVATRFGLENHDSDFGQTLALAGLKSGPFIVLPGLGPTTVRDGFGLLVDGLFRPTTYLFGPGAEIVYQGSEGFVVREANFEALQALEESSVDYYAALRNAYYQDRTAEIWSRREHHRTNGDADGSRGSWDEWQPGTPPRVGPAARAVLRARWPRS